VRDDSNEWSWGASADRVAVVGIAVAAIGLEISLFLPWQVNTRASGLTSIFGSPARYHERRERSVNPSRPDQRRGRSDLGLERVSLRVIDRFDR
jgi:hypothetical protein